MKKQFLTVAVAALALAGCSKNETVEIASNRAIGFSNAFVNNGTRSIDPSLTKTTLKDFDVYGFVTNKGGQSSQIFDGVKVSKSGDDWTYTPPQYWVNGNTYTFGALAPAGAASVTNEAITGTTNKKVGMTVTFTNTNDSQKDLLHAAPAAVTVNSDEYSTPVELTFNHQLSKVKFSFKNSVGVGYSVKVTDVKITDAMTTGTLTVSGEQNTPNAWSNQQTNTLQLTFGNVVADDAESNTAVSIANTETKETYNEKLMIPTPSTTSYTVTFTTELFQGTTSVGTHDHSVTISNVELKLGYCYDFTAELTYENILDPEKPLKPIEFTVNETITDWNKTDQNLDVPTTQIP